MLSEFLADYFRPQFDVVVFNDGFEAKKFIQNTAHHIDGAVINLYMPLIGGEELVSEILAINSKSEIRMISDRLYDAKSNVLNEKYGIVTIPKPFDMVMLEQFQQAVSAKHLYCVR